jgi:hypothetical protein
MAGEVTVVADVLGPEGPLYVGNDLYFVVWVSSTLSKWDGETTTVWWLGPDSMKIDAKGQHLCCPVVGRKDVEDLSRC